MKIALVNSRQDRAGLNIRHHIEELLGEGGRQAVADPRPSYTFYDVEERLIHAERIDSGMDADLLIFLSPITAQTRSRSLRSMSPGTPGQRNLAASPGPAPAAPVMMQAVLRRPCPALPGGVPGRLEVTHHGPTSVSSPRSLSRSGAPRRSGPTP